MSWPLDAWIMALPATLVSYLAGAIPFGLLIARQLKGIDIRSVGSGNIGATNVGRLLGFRFFLLVFALDLLKGLIPTLGLPLALRSLGVPVSADLPVLIGLAAILGHNFPVYLGFKGGKGVATSLGVLLALDPVACGVAAVGFFAVFLLCRYVSLSSIAGSLRLWGRALRPHGPSVESRESRHEPSFSRDRRASGRPPSQEPAANFRGH